MQPLGFAAGAEPCLIHIPHRRLGNQRGDMRGDRRQFFGFLLALGDDAGLLAIPSFPG
jgi:hypothetical protein